MAELPRDDFASPAVMEPLERSPASIARDFRRYLDYHLGRYPGCDNFYLFEALAYVVRDRVMADWRRTWVVHKTPGVRRAHYLSMEYLIGRSLGSHLLNMGLENPTHEALNDFALALEDVESAEPDAGLGNGGLGRLAACFLDSCATLGLPVLGYGLRYEYGMFRQRIDENGCQVEEPDHWMLDGNPWEIERPEFKQTVQFGGRTQVFRDRDGNHRVQWVDTDDVLAVPYDIAITGYGNSVVNTLRLWSASATDAFNLKEFNAGFYAESVAEKNQAENITMVLYPNDASENGKELRLRQQYFLTSASLKDVFRQWGDRDIDTFADGNVFQLNDTHPSIAVAELMRILLDEKGLTWESAWAITSRSMAYTNHTLLPEALEKWPVRLLERLLPRILEIIYEINRRFLLEVRQRWPGDVGRVQRMSLIEEGSEPHVRMAWLAIVGSFSINGVAELHSRLLARGLFRDFHAMWPERFNNKTNGVTPRRWLVEANPELASLLTETIGDGWQNDLDQLSMLNAFANDGHRAFQARWRDVRARNKKRLATLVRERTGVSFDPDSLFDVQVKRIHEYKRQLLNVLHVIYLYNRIRRDGPDAVCKRSVLFGGKAAPGYARAREIVRLINNVARVVNDDPVVSQTLKVSFLPNYGVSAMMTICPAADLSEQISTAGKEASGTGNMKFMLNGAITIGTCDGANIEILDAVGEKNFFLFGLHAEEIEQLRPTYDPRRLVDEDAELAQILHLVSCDHFSPFEPGGCRRLLDAMLSPDDPWMTLADFRSYVDTQAWVEALWRDTDGWTRTSIRNTAASGRFSADRTIRDYNNDIWKLKPLAL
ncbi:MAG: glycogen/starch/alpha-glucan phosphorylase [Proteobacteria bacterium]|nr:MAG: glycogen/starch/alpha-glucan phosphorylase [Pseudomonadota bacterium]